MTSEQHISRRRRGLAAARALALTPMHSIAQGVWPDKPVKLIVPVTADSGTDILARIVREHLGPSMGQNFVAENRLGAEGITVTPQIVRTAPDGNTKGVIASSAIVINQAIYKNTNFRDARLYKETT